MSYIKEIIDYANQLPNRRWYAGIASDPKHRLFSDHNVDPSGYWIVSPMLSEAEARAAEALLLKRGFEGGSGGGNNPRFVYAFLVTNSTR
jgi:hypothetical protein